MLQHAHFSQRFTTRLTAAWWHGGLHVTSGDGRDVAETGKALERLGKLLIR